MLKNLLILILCLDSFGCASTQYNEIYNNSLKTKADTIIHKEGDYQELQTKIAGYFEMQGYKKLEFSDPKKDLFVYSREGDFSEPCRIIVKYTLKPGDDQIRIDLMNGSDDELVTDSQVTNDIQIITGLIKDH